VLQPTVNSSLDLSVALTDKTNVTTDFVRCLNNHEYFETTIFGQINRLIYSENRFRSVGVQTKFSVGTTHFFFGAPKDLSSNPSRGHCNFQNIWNFSLRNRLEIRETNLPCIGNGTLFLNSVTVYVQLFLTHYNTLNPYPIHIPDFGCIYQIKFIFLTQQKGMNKSEKWTRRFRHQDYSIKVLYGSMTISRSTFTRNIFAPKTFFRR
jgi:hypothetical protein